MYSKFHFDSFSRQRDALGAAFRELSGGVQKISSNTPSVLKYCRLSNFDNTLEVVLRDGLQGWLQLVYVLLAIFLLTIYGLSRSFHSGASACAVVRCLLVRTIPKSHKTQWNRTTIAILLRLFIIYQGMQFSVKSLHHTNQMRHTLQFHQTVS